MLAWLSRRLELEPGEVRRALMLGGMLFALTSSYTLVKTARDALFLSSFPINTLAYVYIGVGVLTLAASVLFTLTTRNRRTSETLAGVAIVSAISLALFAAILNVDTRWGPVVLYLWVNIYGLVLMSQFWTYTNSLSNPREAKRIFGVIGIGGILGGLAGGMLATPLARTVGLGALLTVGALLLAGLAASVFAVVRHTPPAPPDRETAAEPGIDRLSKHPYVRWLALAALCSVLVTSLLDFSFKAELQRRYQSSAEMAEFLGAFYTVVNLAALVVQLFVSRWALQVLGAGWSAAVLPTGLALGAGLTLVFPGFRPVITTRLWDQVMRQSVNRTAVELFYFPLEPGLRRRAKALIEAGLERVGDGLAGLVIIVVGAAAGLGTTTLAALILVLVAVWVCAWLGVRRGYVAELGRNLRRMNLSHQHEPVSLREASLMRETVHLLDSPHERVVLYGMEILEDAAPEELVRLLPQLIGHPSPAVRARALAVAGRRNVESLATAVAAALEDPDPTVRVAALRAYTVLGQQNPTAAIEEFLDSEDPRLRAAAIEIVIEFAPPAEEARIQGLIERRLQGGDVLTRAAIAEALGRRSAPSRLHDLLAVLLRDPELEVRRAALVSAGRAQRREFIPVLIEALGVRATTEAARAGLAGYGDRVVGTLGDYLADLTVPAEIRHPIPRVLSDIRSQEAVNALLRCREMGDVRQWYRVLKALNRIRASGAPVTFPRDRVTEDLVSDARSMLFAYVHYRSCPLGNPRSAERLFCIALNERIDQALNRVFRRLGLLYPPDAMLAAYQGVTSDDPRARGSALEYLENALTPDHRALVLPLVDDAGDEGRLRFARQRFGLRFESYERTLEETLRGEDQWLRTCALFVIGARREKSLLPGVMEALSSFDPRVRETANWATLALATGG